MLHTNWRIGCAVVALAALGIGAIPCDANFLVNGDMELGGSPTTPPTGWLGGFAGVTNDTPDASSQSVFILSTNGSFSSDIYQSFPLVPFEDAVKVSYSFKGDATYWGLYANNFSITITADLTSPSAGWSTYESGWINVPLVVTNLQLVIYDVTDNATPILIDNVSLIPEPSSALLLGIGVLGLGWIRRLARR